MVPSVKCLPCKQEDPGLVLSTHIKSQVHACSPSDGKTETGGPAGASLLVSVAKSACSLHTYKHLNIQIIYNLKY